jgi:predicted  nucleic acid-binding Zn-ribbon protein
MTPHHEADELAALREQVDALRTQLAKVEAEAAAARHEAVATRCEVLDLRDQVTAAERDQQDLRTARARLARLNIRALIARLLHPT